MVWQLKKLLSSKIYKCSKYVHSRLKGDVHLGSKFLKIIKRFENPNRAFKQTIKK